MLKNIYTKLVFLLLLSSLLVFSVNAEFETDRCDYNQGYSSPTLCISFEQQDCLNTPLCGWSSSSCGGTATACNEIYNSNDCGKNPGCNWNGSICDGSAEPCTSFSGKNTCNSAPGCGWKIGACVGSAEPCDSNLRDSAEKCELDISCEWFEPHIDVDGDGFSPRDNCEIGETPVMNFVGDAGTCPVIDCNDTNNNIFPGAYDIPLDGIDQDCKGGDSQQAFSCDNAVSSCIQFYKVNPDNTKDLISQKQCKLTGLACFGCGDVYYGVTPDPCILECNETRCWKLGNYSVNVLSHQVKNIGYTLNFDARGEEKCNAASYDGRTAYWFGAGGDKNCCGDDPGPGDEEFFCGAQGSFMGCVDSSAVLDADQSERVCNSCGGDPGAWIDFLGRCCGDDNNENRHTRSCTAGVCSSNTTDISCCSSTTDCVYDSTCYRDFGSGDCGGSQNTCVDTGDDSIDLEICQNSEWQDADNSRELCEELNSTIRPTKWMVRGVCGLKESEEGDCNDAATTYDNFCCGDDEKEIMKEGFDDVCFITEKDCYSYVDDAYYNEGGYVEDDYCEDGGITSRTKMVFLQLLDIANQVSPDDYVLFCDYFENSLNYYLYVLWEESLGEYLEWANNICVLKLPEQVIFGTSLNQPINEGAHPFIYTLDGITNCNNAIDDNDGDFHQCSGGDSKAWYNSKMQSVIYSREDIYNLPSDFDLDFWGAFRTFLKNPFQTIFDFLMGLFEQEGELEDYGFINSTKRFSRIYLNRKGDKNITGIAEEIKEPVRGEYISVTYEGFSENICDTFDIVKEKIEMDVRSDQIGLLLCKYDAPSGKHYVAINSSFAIDLWPELTAKLRP